MTNKELTEQNEALKARVAELEAQLAVEPAEGEDGPAPEILQLAAKLIREAIFSNGGIAGSQVEGLRALAADLEAASTAEAAA